VDGDRLTLVTDGAVSGAVERLLARFGRGELLEPLTLPDTVWLVLGVVVLEQPITRAEISARRLVDSDRQVQLPLQHRLVREEPRAALPGRGIPLVTTDLVLRRLGVGSLGELQRRIL
jgi:chromosome segregation and condensation protein ScpB